MESGFPLFSVQVHVIDNILKGKKDMMMPYRHVIKVSIPISSYYDNEIFFQDLYFETSPEKEDVIDRCNKLDQEALDLRDKSMYFPIWKEATEITKLIPDDIWKKVVPGGVTNASLFVCHPKFGRQSYSWDLIDVWLPKNHSKMETIIDNQECMLKNWNNTLKYFMVNKHDNFI